MHNEILVTTALIDNVPFLQQSQRPRDFLVAYFLKRLKYLSHESLYSFNTFLF